MTATEEKIPPLAHQASWALSMSYEQMVARLTRLGYRIEDMGAEYGEEWAGQFRWFYEPHEGYYDFQDSDTSDSIVAAWDSAWEHHLSLEDEVNTATPEGVAVRQVSWSEFVSLNQSIRTNREGGLSMQIGFDQVAGSEVYAWSCAGEVFGYSLGAPQTRAYFMKVS